MFFASARQCLHVVKSWWTAAPPSGIILPPHNGCWLKWVAKRIFPPPPELANGAEAGAQLIDKYIGLRERSEVSAFGHFIPSHPLGEIGRASCRERGCQK